MIKIINRRVIYLLGVARKFIKFLKDMEINPVIFLTPVVLSIIVAFLEGMSMALLMPLAKGVIYRDFAYISRFPVIKYIIPFFEFRMMNPKSWIFFTILFLVFFTVVAKNIFQYFNARIVAAEANKFVHNLRCKAFARYLSFGEQYFDSKNKGELSTVLIQFTGRIAINLRTFQTAMSTAFTLFVYLGMMFYISWQLALGVLMIFPILHYFVRGLVRNIERTSMAYAEEQKRLGKKTFNIFTCMPLVKGYNMEGKEKSKFLQLSMRLREVSDSINIKSALLTPIHDITAVGTLLILIMSVAVFIKMEIMKDITRFMLFLIILKRSTNSFGIFNQIKVSIAEISGPIRSLKKVFDDQNKYFVKGGSRTLDALKDSIEIKGLDFSYGRGERVLHNIDITIRENTVTALVGSSGSGKTTIAKILLRLYECPEGKVFIDGVDIKDYCLYSIRKNVAYVSQDTLLFDDTIRGNMVYGITRDVTDEELVEVAKKSRIYDYICRLPNGFDTETGDRGVKLSGGERQRIAIARALLKGSEILILDEATSALDSITEKLVQEAIEDAVSGKTSIVIAHRLSTIKQADNIIVLKDGYVAENGTLNELLDKKGYFYDLWQQQYLIS